jgi:phosphonate transport system substrate-binding protein
VVAVLQRQYDAAVTWASGIGDVSQGFTRGNLRAMVEKGMLNMRDLRIIWRQRPIMNGPTPCAATCRGVQGGLRLFHLALPRAHPDIYAPDRAWRGRRLPRGRA